MLHSQNNSELSKFTVANSKHLIKQIIGTHQLINQVAGQLQFLESDSIDNSTSLDSMILANSVGNNILLFY